MQREIKFRAFNKETKTMHRVLCIDFDAENIHYIHNDFCYFDPFDEMELMEFTGLTDKNGVEIYEGDVVKDYVIDVNFEVVYTDYANFGLKSNKRHFKSNEYEVVDSSYASTTLEIIGNIHKNPELLK